MRPLRLHQKKMLKYLLANRFFALFVEMRLGKTLPIIRRFSLLPALGPKLIALPNGAIYGWVRELGLECGRPPIILTGTRNQRLHLLRNSNADYYIINKEGFLALPELKDYAWGAVILDESIFIKSPKSKVSKYFTKNFRSAEYRGILTGAPAPEGSLNYYQQLLFLSHDYWTHRSFWAFRAKYCEPKKYSWVLTKAGEEYVKGVLAKHCFFMSKREAGLGNVKVHETRMASFDKKMYDIYDKLAKTFIFEMDGVELNRTIYSTVRYTMMRRMFGGIIGGKLVSRHKLDSMLELMRGELYKEKIVIWCDFLDEVEVIHKELSKEWKVAKINGATPQNLRPKIIKEFNEGKFTHLIGHPACFKYATDLSSSKTMFFYSTPLSTDTRLQVEERIENIHIEPEPRLYVDFITENTIEDIIVDGIKNKEARQMIFRRVIQKLQQERENA